MKVSILVVEDEISLLKAYCEFLESLCNIVYPATNAKEAMEIYKKHRPDIILTDIKLPKTNGLDLIKQIRKKDKDTRIIIVSAYSNKEYSLSAISSLVKRIRKKTTKQLISSCYGFGYKMKLKKD